MINDSDNPRTPKRRRTQLENLGDVRRVLGEVCRRLRSSKGLFEAEVDRSRALVYALSKLAELMVAQDLHAIPLPDLEAEIDRRIGVGPTPGAQEPAIQ